ncbi:MAG TPA: cyclic nucleotide-binding domain-containing protein [Terracidiphilus sp.]
MKGTKMADLGIAAPPQRRQKMINRQSPIGCAACSNRQPGWFCSLGSAVLADLELVTSTISLPSQASLFTQGEDARCLYLICSGYLKLTAGRAQDRQMIVRVAGPGSVLGLYAALSHGVYEVSAESLTSAQLRPVERERFLTFLRNHREAQMRSVQCICQEYRFALQDACRIALAETVAGRLGRLLLELAHQIGEHVNGGLSFPTASHPRRDGVNGLHNPRNCNPHPGPIPQRRGDHHRRLDDHSAPARSPAEPALE